MSLALSDSGLLRDVSDYYESKLHEFGPTARVIFRLGGELVVMRADELLPARFELGP